MAKAKELYRQLRKSLPGLGGKERVPSSEQELKRERGPLHHV